MRPESLIFDIDGTLWDSRVIIAEGYNTVLRQEGYPELCVDAEFLKTVFGKTMADIADIMLAELKDSLSARGLSLSWNEDVRQLLVKKAYSVTYGARNLRRTIQKELEDPISEAIIDSFENPISSIEVTVEMDAVKLNIQ